MLFVVITCFIVGLIVFILIRRKSKSLKIDNVYFVSGGVKTGKTFLSVALAVKTYKKNLRYYKITSCFKKCLYKITKNVKYKDILFEPMLYSNIPLKYVKFNNLTLDIILRKVRLPNRSVVLIDETSLLADSMLYKDKSINSALMCFYKLFAHYTHGGTLICNSQSISDNHYSLKRCMSRYLYVYQRCKLPFFTKFSCREMIYSDDGSAVNVFDKDIELVNRVCFFSNKYYKYYDCYCYSVFTDDLMYYVNYDKKPILDSENLKCNVLVSLQDFGTLDRRKYAKKQKVAMINFARGVKNEKK